MVENTTRQSLQISFRSPSARMPNVAGKSSMSTVTLLPLKDSQAEFTVRVTSATDGSPLTGQKVKCETRSISLIGSKWRTKDGLVRQFKDTSGQAAAEKIRQEICADHIRLGVKVTPVEAITDAVGKAVFQLDGFHICGDEDSPATDLVTAFSGGGGLDRVVVTSAFAGLEPLVDDTLGGLTTSGLGGRYLQPQVIQVLKAIGQAWRRTQGMPPGTPKFITITGASLRWGGINPPHLAHRFGGSVDIRPIGKKGGPVSVNDECYCQGGTEKLITYLIMSGASQILFADQFIANQLKGVVKFAPDHENHIHASWLKDPNESWNEFPELVFVPPEFWIFIASNEQQ